MAVTREQVINTIMKRDGISYEDAKDLVNETGWQIADAIDMGLGYDAVEEILMDFLGLEMDYVFAFL
ncbi:MAG: hypothetical protein J6S67_01485 [Methanobrevibacter sp.]|nr:hypothetical protein [Methanobrevibacter sp.]